MIQLPTHMEFTLATLALYVWASLYHRQGEKQRHQKRIIAACLIANALFYLLFFSVLGALVLLEEKAHNQPKAVCARPPNTPPLVLLDRFYKAGVAFTALALAVFVGLCVFHFVHL